MMENTSNFGLTKIIASKKRSHIRNSSIGGYSQNENEQLKPSSMLSSAEGSRHFTTVPYKDDQVVNQRKSRPDSPEKNDEIDVDGNNIDN